MASKLGQLLAIVTGMLFAVTAALAQGDNAQWLDVQFPRDSPVLPISFSLRPSTARAIGNSTTLDLHASILLRNTSAKSITGLTLRIEAQDLAPAGKASLTVPSLHAQPGDVFPLRLDLELRKPFGAIAMQGATVQVTLDCALFKDLTSYGPDKLNSRRSLLVFELQARRERQYVASLLEAGRLSEIREELNFGLQELQQPTLGLEVSHLPGGPGLRRATSNLDTMNFAGSPVRPTGGSVRIADGNISSPQIDVINDSQRTIRSVEVGWIVRDEHGKEYLAGSMPVAIQLKPVETGTVSEPATLRFFRAAGQPVAIESLTAFVSEVEFINGEHWIPSRSDISAATKNPVLRRALIDSPEQQRLAEIYRRKGISGLTSELKRAE